MRNEKDSEEQKGGCVRRRMMNEKKNDEMNAKTDECKDTKEKEQMKRVTRRVTNAAHSAKKRHL